MILEPNHDFGFRNNVSVWAVSAVCLILVSAGCKSGASFSKPSWWAFGANTDPSQLASAPPHENEETSGVNGVSKPSAMASPYPTTTTPEAYVMADDASPSPSERSASPLPQYPSTDDATPITYGQTNPSLSYPETGNIADADGMSKTPAGVSAQTGPYATLPVEPSENGPAVSLDQTPAATQSRIADSRVGSSFGDPVSSEFATPPSPDVLSQPQSSLPSSESRYGEANSSRFGSNSISEAAVGASLGSPAVARPEPAPSQFEQDPIAPDPIKPGPWPGESPAGPTPSAPRRRPDPGYRPGGTSSYTPSSSILVGEPKTNTGVETAGFEKQSQPIR